jgi:hypothetical protein
LTVTALVQNKVYDGGTAATATYADDRVSGDALAVTGSVAFLDKNAGTGKTVNVSGVTVVGADAANYALASNSATATADISTRQLDVTAQAQNKVYDGSMAATINYADNRVAGDAISVTGSGAFLDKNAGTGKTVNVAAITLGGADAANYSLASSSATSTADISTRPLNVTAQAQNKVYDGSMAATINYADNRVAGDAITVTGSGAFLDKNAGTGKTVNVAAITLGGADAANYSLASSSATSTADISTRPLTVTALVQNKVYDGGTAATATYADDRVSGDALAVTGTAAFLDKNAGTGKTVNVSGVTVVGADAANYSLASSSASSTADITTRPLTVTAQAQNKVYDGSMAATINYADNRVAGDALTITGSGAFLDKNAGTGKTVNVAAITLGGADAANYSLVSSSATLAADISTRPLNVTAQAQNKIYDGSTAATVTYADDRVSGDTLAVAGSASFLDKHVGIAKLVSAGGLSITGADAPNYVLANATANTTADISATTLFVVANDATSQSGAALPPFAATHSGFMPGDSAASTLGGSLLFSTNATITSLPGIYNILPSGYTLLTSNYSVVYKAGTLTLTPGFISTTGVPSAPGAPEGGYTAALSSLGALISGGGAGGATIAGAGPGASGGAGSGVASTEGGAGASGGGKPAAVGVRAGGVPTSLLGGLLSIDPELVKTLE